MLQNTDNTFAVINGSKKSVLRPSSKIGSFDHHRLPHGLKPIDDNNWFQTKKQAVDISIWLSELKENTFLTMHILNVNMFQRNTIDWSLNRDK